MTVTESPKPLRERKHELVCNELRAVALGHLAEHGYDDTTVDELAKAAGISRRTFFRYFPAKDDVVAQSFDEICESITGSIARQPAGTPPLEVIRTALLEGMASIEKDPARSRILLRMIHGHPRLHGRFLDRQVESRNLLAEALAERMDDRLEAEVMSGLAYTVYDVALARWLEDETAELQGTIDAAFETLISQLAAAASVTARARAGDPPPAAPAN